MKPYRDMTPEERQHEYAAVKAHYDELKSLNLKLDMSRGKPGRDQLDKVSDILTVLTRDDCLTADGDMRNYGVLAGAPAAQRLWADILGCRPEEVFVGGNASLQLMYDLIAKAWSFGLLHSEKPWCREEGLKWLCPAPGYDRHFAITELFGIEMITVKMTPEGPDMDAVEELIKDPKVKGMWTVPKYSNPDGIIYSDEVIRRIANMKPAAPDFALMWDNAYVIHEFDGDYIPFPDIISLCREAGNPDMVYEFASTSKVTLPGAGISCMAASVDNQKYLQKLIGVQVISYDKVNQMRHVKYLQNKEHALEIMKRHAEVLKPHFEAVLKALEAEIRPAGIGHWETPKGGYFISLYTLPGLAKRTVALTKEAGVTLTGAGATFPYGKDPEDSNIRIAPSLPPTAELEQAIEVLCTALKLAALEQLNA